MSGDRPTTFHGHWAAVVVRLRRLRNRPLLVNVRSVLERIPFHPLDVNWFYLLEYIGVPPEHTAFLRGRAEIRAATMRDLDALVACKGNRAWQTTARRTFLNRFKADDTCAVAMLDGRMIAYQWICHRSVYVEERYGYAFDIPPDTVYTYDIFMRPEHRVAGLWVKFHAVFLREFMLKLRRNKILGMVDFGNRLSMNTHLRYGFRPVKKVFVITLFGRSVFTHKPIRDGEVRPRGLSSAEMDSVIRRQLPELSQAPAGVSAVEPDSHSRPGDAADG